MIKNIRNDCARALAFQVLAFIMLRQFHCYGKTQSHRKRFLLKQVDEEQVGVWEGGTEMSQSSCINQKIFRQALDAII